MTKTRLSLLPTCTCIIMFFTCTFLIIITVLVTHEYTSCMYTYVYNYLHCARNIQKIPFSSPKTVNFSSQFKTALV